MNRSVKTGGALVAFGAVLSQLGHLLVYQLQFGSAALVIQSTGAHAYFRHWSKRASASPPRRSWRACSSSAPRDS